MEQIPAAEPLVEFGAGDQIELSSTFAVNDRSACLVLAAGEQAFAMSPV